MNLTFAGGFTAKDLSDDPDPFLKSKLFTYILMDIFENGLKSTQSYVSADSSTPSTIHVLIVVLPGASHDVMSYRINWLAV